jgi:hypothetical protein
MNKAFTKSKELVLDEKYKITPDSDSGVIIVFTEPRVKTNKKTGLQEPFIFVENHYFPRIAQALRHYASKVINTNISSIDECILINESVFKLIDKLDKEFKQF